MPGSKTDNTNIRLKLSIREWAGTRLGEEWRVLDLYCGSEGRMYSGIWYKAADYFGVDKNVPHKLANTCRMSAEVASQQLNLDDYNVFDIDPYSNPWPVARQIIRRRGAGKFAMILTSSEYRGNGFAFGCEIVRRSIGASGLSNYSMLGHFSDLVTRLMVRSLAEIDGVRLLAAARAKTSTNVEYISLVLDKQSV